MRLDASSWVFVAAAIKQLEHNAFWERKYYDVIMARQPTIEQDIDWRAPFPCRPMQEADLGG